MAQTKEIYDEILSEKENYSELQELQPEIDDSQTLANDLTTSSKVGVWRIFTWIIASRIKDLQDLFVQLKNEIIEIMQRQHIGNLQWYQTIAKEFQFGDALIYNSKKLRYEYGDINTENRIVKLASANEGSLRNVVIKVANLDGNNPQQLTSPELAALNGYLNKLKFAGVQVEAVSRPADNFKVYLKVFYDPLVLYSNGAFISDISVFPVENAINDYLKNLPFDGNFNVTEMIDKVQQAEGVVNPLFQSAGAKYGLFDYDDIGPITDYYNANAGYLQIDPMFPLHTTITYVSI